MDVSIACLNVVASTLIEWLGIHLQAGLMIHDSDQCTILSVTLFPTSDWCELLIEGTVVINVENPSRLGKKPYWELMLSKEAGPLNQIDVI